MLRGVFGHLRRQPVAFVALFVALGGTAIAAGASPVLLEDSPAGGDLTGTYPNPTIAAGKVTTAKLADGAVTTNNFANGALAPEAASLRFTTKAGDPGPSLGAGTYFVVVKAGLENLPAVPLIGYCQVGTGSEVAFSNAIVLPAGSTKDIQFRA